MSFLPIVSPWFFWPVAALLLAATGWTLLKNRGTAGWHAGSQNTRAARWRLAALVVLVVLAAARPGLAGASAPVASSDLNVFFVVDVSPSSAAEDYDGASPRLAGMQADINALAAELPGARFSLISFDSTAKVLLPLTTDATALRTLTQVLAPGTAYTSKGSSITAAGPVLGERLAAAQQSHPDRPRLVFYLGDGEQTAAAAPEPFAEGTELIDGGAVLGYGTAAGGHMRDHSFSAEHPGPYILDKTANYAPATSRIDEKALGSVAGQLEVPYVHRGSPADISAALAASAPKGSAAPGNNEQQGAGRWELYWLFALAGFGVAAWEVVRLGIALRRLPGDKPSGGRLPGARRPSGRKDAP
ncbi:VWA domain-containing protein [Arthrobacter sp. H35-D1]|uniref:vWA domain-containing protein n=1 Tax=Arthrobacter sp. H35-D1 TaxID=3046202 RepID=UPI0024BAE1E8|nr:VWA domain-containing protein [Arthrobacter sp. H35-D1]MDJ0313957.1 VWA domain-containing protein [Arthrobacter sp. H35-D1]